MIRTSLTALLFAVVACPLSAEVPPKSETGRHIPAPPQGVAGTIVSVSESRVVLRQKNGTEVSVEMTAGWTVSRPRPSTLAELRIGDFIGSANVDLEPNRGRANELRVFEAGYRPEYGTHPIAAAGTSMTHGFVFAITPLDAGAELDIAYPGGKRTIVIPDGLTIQVSDLLPRSVAVQGLAVTGVTRLGPDGVRRASRLTLPGRAQ